MLELNSSVIPDDLKKYFRPKRKYGPWICRNVNAWWKRSTMPASAKDRFTVDWEPVFFFSAKKDYYFEQQFETIETQDDLRHTSNGDGETSRGGHIGYNPLGRNARTVWHGNEPLPYRLKDSIPKEQLEWLLKTFMEPSTVPQGNVWDVTSQGTGLEHYASYPIELCRRPILAGCPEYICPKCGKSRVKMYRQGSLVNDGHARLEVSDKFGGDNDSAWYRPGGMGITMIPSAHYENEFIGYSDCGCQIDGKPIPLAQCQPGVVLDPFMGTASTLVEAKLLGRKSIGIDISEAYVKMAVKRLGSAVRQGEMR